MWGEADFRPVRTGSEKIAHRPVKRSRDDKLYSDFSKGFKNEPPQMQSGVRDLQTVGLDDVIRSRQDIEIQGPRLPGMLCGPVPAVTLLDGHQVGQQLFGVEAALARQYGIQVVRLWGRTLPHMRLGFPDTGYRHDRGPGQCIDTIHARLQVGVAMAEVRSERDMIGQLMCHADTKSGPQDGSCGPLCIVRLERPVVR